MMALGPVTATILVSSYIAAVEVAKVLLPGRPLAIDTANVGRR